MFFCCYYEVTKTVRLRCVSDVRADLFAPCCNTGKVGVSSLQETVKCLVTSQGHPLSTLTKGNLDSKSNRLFSTGVVTGGKMVEGSR